MLIREKEHDRYERKVENLASDVLEKGREGERMKGDEEESIRNVNKGN